MKIVREARNRNRHECGRAACLTLFLRSCICKRDFTRARFSAFTYCIIFLLAIHMLGALRARCMYSLLLVVWDETNIVALFAMHVEDAAGNYRRGERRGCRMVGVGRATV